MIMLQLICNKRITRWRHYPYDLCPRRSLLPGRPRFLHFYPFGGIRAPNLPRDMSWCSNAFLRCTGLLLGLYATPTAELHHPCGAATTMVPCVTPPGVPHHLPFPVLVPTARAVPRADDCITPSRLHTFPSSPHISITPSLHHIIKPSLHHVIPPSSITSPHYHFITPSHRHHHSIILSQVTSDVVMK